ncbi:MAG: UDP-N-acetylmuramoyl-tripeptide--D-alanyl-D-alanine ligase [Oscillospiraceae bacterium]|nr:UDP-N-acetylmuramoyl-tripeptide--D-alanyl-D-alanine ligase [Oscillospiraceae bacterium]
MDLERAARACSGALCGRYDGHTQLREIAIDSRKVRPGDLFVAYKGENVDGHDYISAAFDRGAACCLAERIPAGEERPILLVDDVQRALESIAADFRSELRIPLVGITGSVGKTSAKEMIAAVLEQHFCVLKTEGNLNNQIGVPMTISRICPEHTAAVVEMGISGFGEMRDLARIARPTIAVFTVIGQAHLEFLHDRAGVFKAKTEMLDEMADDAVVLVNGDDDLLAGLRCRQRVLRFGIGEDCEIRAVDIRVDRDGCYTCTIVFGDRKIPAAIPAFGQHMIYAALEGAAVGIELGLSDDEIAAGISRYVPVGSRSAVTRTEKFMLIDDSYNANPDSVRCGIDSLTGLKGRHVCILGDMLELGETEGELHRQIGAYAAQKGVELLLCTGPLSEQTAKGAGDAGRWYPDKESLIRALPELIRPGDQVLVKASRGMHFETIAEALRAL